MRARHYLLFPLFGLLSLSGCDGCGGCIKNTTKTVTENTVKGAKNALSGISEGIEEGRKDGEGIDGAVVVSTYDEIDAHVEVSVLSATASADNRVELEISFSNKSDKPVRIIGLNEAKNMTLIDAQGFSTYIKSGPAQVTVQAGAKEKYKFVFEGDLQKAAKFKFHGHELDLPPVGLGEPKA